MRVRLLGAVSALLLAAGCGTSAGPSDPVDPATRPGSSVSWLARTPSASYTLEAARWGVSTNGTNATATTTGLQNALKWASRHSIGTVRLPAGTYLVGIPQTSKYLQGVWLPSNMTLELAPKATLKVVPNDRWAYCAVALTNARNVVIRGGTIQGDRYTHAYAAVNGSTAHDEGHGVCVKGLSRDVLIEDVRVTETTGDGVLLMGGSQAGDTVQNVTVRRTELDHNRRQGISVVRGLDVTIEDNVIHDISGVAPMFGVDLETPDGAGHSQDVLIRRNRFRDNRGGHVASFDATNVWIENNTMSQTAGAPMLDAPIVLHQYLDVSILNNHITMTDRTVNGLIGIIVYPTGANTPTGATSHIQGNRCTTCGFYLRSLGPVDVRGNTLTSGFIAIENLATTLVGNSVTSTTLLPGYSFTGVTGSASGNVLNGTTRTIPLSSIPYTKDLVS